jgi:hypothetical protein
VRLSITANTRVFTRLPGARMKVVGGDRATRAGVVEDVAGAVGAGVVDVLFDQPGEHVEHRTPPATGWRVTVKEEPATSAARDLRSAPTANEVERSNWMCGCRSGQDPAWSRRWRPRARGGRLHVPDASGPQQRAGAQNAA